MSYSRTCGNLTIHVACISNPEATYNEYFSVIEAEVVKANYKPETSMKNLIKNIVLMFDCDDNYGEYSPESGCGGYGDEFSVENCMQYVEDSGGFTEFDYYI